MSLLALIEWSLVGICLVAAISIVFYTIRYGISPMPSSLAVRRELWLLLPELDSGEIYELGSGFGTLAIPLAKKYPNLKITGFEISPFPFWIAKIRATLLGLNNLCFKRANFLEADLSKPCLLVSYLYPEGMRRIAGKIETIEGRTQYFLSHTFALPGHQPCKQSIASDLYRSPIYLYDLSQSASSTSPGEA